MFKKGDKIKRKNGSPFSNDEYVVTVKEVVGNDVFLEGLGTYTHYDDVERVTTPRPHSELIKAWADDDSAVVQCRDLLEAFPVWSDVMGTPSWFDNLEYCIKPEKSEVDERIEALEAELMALKEARKAESR